jgi:multiple sugar transport system substrate-binding protein
MRGILKAALAATAVLAVALPSATAWATDNIVWWDFLSGGDGVRMKAMIADFNKEHEGKIHIDATTLDWGTPFYTKVQTSTAVGQGPDIMTYHESRIPLGISTNVLSPIKPDEMAAAGIKASDFEPANWKKAEGADGTQYAIPLDVHSIILYYNKTLLKQAGLLGDDGKPKGLDGAANWDAALAKLTTNGVYGLTVPTADGATMWRIFYTLLNQQDGVFFADNKFLDGDNLDKATTAMTEMNKWVKNKWTPSQTEYPASIAQFTSGKAAMMINGVWEVPTMVDLAKQGKLFDWGAVMVPTLYAHPATWADSHSFAIPNRQGNPVPENIRKDDLEIIHWFNEHSIMWAGGGHIPAYKPVRDSQAFKDLKPNSDYAQLIETAVFDPVSTLAGVASPVYDAAGNYIMPAMNGEMSPSDAASQMRDDLQGQVQ